MHLVVEHLEAVNKLDEATLHGRELLYKKSFSTYVSNNLLEAANILQAMLVEYPLGEAVHQQLIFVHEFYSPCDIAKDLFSV